MAKLKVTFERLGFENVRTFINSGNVIFETDGSSPEKLAASVEEAIEKDFGFSVTVLLRDVKQIKALVEAIPSNWVNDKDVKCDVMFLQKKIDSPDILTRLPEHSAAEDTVYLPGAVLWRVDRQLASKSKMLKLAGMDLYKSMTVRNPNTVRKLYELMR